MEGSPIDIVIFAPLAAFIGVLLFWFIQLLFIESEKYFLIKIKQKHEALYRFTNFLGIFFQNICHALGYTITKSGISEFYLSINYGKVAPKKEKKGIFEWISNGFLFIGPFFIPALLIFISLFFLLKNGLEISIPGQFLNSKYTFIGQLNIFSASLYGFASSYFRFLANIDLLHPVHIGFLILMTFLAMGIRPSYIGEPKQKKVNIFYDLKNICNLITFKPLYLILLMSMFYIFFYISLYLNQNWYIGLFVVLGWLSVVSITSILIANLILWLLHLNDNISGKIRFLPFIVLVLSYSLIRVFFLYVPHKNTNTISLFVTGLSTTIVTILLYKTKTNKFKTSVGIKSLKKGKKKEKIETNEEKRIIKK
jgi:hypothetical protein